MLKLNLREASRRVNQEAEEFSRLEKLARNLGWSEVAGTALLAAEALSEADARIREAAEAAARLQAEATEAHERMHKHAAAKEHGEESRSED